MASSGSIEIRGVGQFPRWLIDLAIFVPTLTHFGFASFALLHILAWPNSFLFVHVFLVLAGFWAMLDKAGWQPVVAFLVVLVVSAVTDIVALGVYFDIVTSGSQEYPPASLGKFTAAMVIMNLLGKPLTLVLGVLSLIFRFMGGGAKSSDYSQIHGTEEGQQE